MARTQSKAQKETVARVMHEFKHGDLKIRGSGPTVKNPKQAIAIALHQAGATNTESARDNSRTLNRTKDKERRGRTAKAEAEGKAAQDRTLRKHGGGAKAASVADSGKTKAALYEEARRRDIPGRSKMSRTELANALGC